MAHSEGKDKDKEFQAPDTMAAAIEPTRSRDDQSPERGDDDLRHSPSAENSDKIDPVEDDAGDRDGEVGPRRAQLTTTKSYATDTSAATGRTGAQEPEALTWYQKLNPLRWGPVPPIPDERVPSREHQAGFFSALTFAWMAPLMSVSLVAPAEAQ
jgi:ATP-binding cassette, subfamily C (CFTR/MRP), member 1